MKQSHAGSGYLTKLGSVSCRFPPPKRFIVDPSNLSRPFLRIANVRQQGSCGSTLPADTKVNCKFSGAGASFFFGSFCAQRFGEETASRPRAFPAYPPVTRHAAPHNIHPLRSLSASFRPSDNILRPRRLALTRDPEVTRSARWRLVGNAWG